MGVGVGRWSTPLPYESAGESWRDEEGYYYTKQKTALGLLFVLMRNLIIMLVLLRLEGQTSCREQFAER